MDESSLPLIKAFLAQISSAMKISELLSKHNSEDSEISVDQIIGGLVYRLMVPMDGSEIESSMNSAKQIIDKLDETDSEEEYDEIEECYANEEDKKTFNRRVKAPICNCDVCSKVRICLLNYKIHDCSDPLAQKFKNAIDHTSQEHKIYI